MDDTTGLSTVEHGGMTLTSVGVSAEDIKTSLAQTSEAKEAPDKPAKDAKPAKQTVSDHARELGKRGGKAAAEKRAEAKGKAGSDGDDSAPAEGRERRQEAVATAPKGTPEEGEDSGDEAKDEELTRRQRRRVEVATRKQAEARRELEAERQARAAERARYEADLAARSRQEAPRGEADARGGAAAHAERDSPGKPREEDFERYSDYLDARDEYNRKQWTQEQERLQHAEREVHTYRGHVDNFLQHAGPDLMEEIDPELLDIKPYFMLGDNEPVTPDSLIAGEIVYLGEHAPAVMRHLSDNLDELQRLRALRSHADIRVELRVLARTLGSRSDATAGSSPEKGEQAPKPATSRAHPPVRPVTGAPHVADGDPQPREGEDFDAWMRRTSKKGA
jgi:hypothetical protein